MNLRSPVELLDLEPKSSNILKEVLAGLSKSQKTIPPKFLYDKKGSEIFEKICELPEYYPTRTENKILTDNAASIAEMIGEEALIIEPGSGSASKVRHLLRKLKKPAGYVPIEISREILLRTSEEIIGEFPGLNVIPVCGDFTQEIELPLSVDGQRGRKVIFFPGSTIGNLNPSEAINFLRRCGKVIGNNGGVLIGADLKKDVSKLEKAYDDSQGITAAFNLNLLERLNREINASFNLENFHHVAHYNEAYGRIEMHLKSKIAQLVKVHETIFRFREGETIHTENSYKYTSEEFCEMCAKAGLVIKKLWKDSDKMFCVYYFEKE